MAERCRNCPEEIEPVGVTGLWEDKAGITQCLKAPLGAKPGERVMHQPMPAPLREETSRG